MRHFVRSAILKSIYFLRGEILMDIPRPPGKERKVVSGLLVATLTAIALYLNQLVHFYSFFLRQSFKSFKTNFCNPFFFVRD